MQPEAYKIQQALPSIWLIWRWRRFQGPTTDSRVTLPYVSPSSRICCRESMKVQDEQCLKKWMDSSSLGWRFLSKVGHPCSGFERDSEESIYFAFWFHYEHSTQDLILPTNLMSSSKCRTEFEVNIGPRTWQYSWIRANIRTWKMILSDSKHKIIVLFWRIGSVSWSGRRFLVIGGVNNVKKCEIPHSWQGLILHRTESNVKRL